MDSENMQLFSLHLIFWRLSKEEEEEEMCSQKQYIIKESEGENLLLWITQALPVHPSYKAYKNQFLPHREQISSSVDRPIR
jgi:hypothetical protein